VRVESIEERYIAAALTDLLFTPGLELHEADRHFARGYRQRTDGAWDDRDGFLEHIAHLRTVPPAYARMRSSAPTTGRVRPGTPASGAPRRPPH
jgi:hypothetical protein